MNRPRLPHMMAAMYRNPSPHSSHWRPSGPYPQTGFQYRPSRHFRPPARNLTNGKNDEQWCETCDRGFPTADLLKQHKEQHQKCNIDGCQFVAHPKVITKHIQMQHSTGLYKKIANLTNPEEIEKWREERKKKYPTRTNIEKKAAESKEKIERGEKMALKRNKNDDKKPTDQAIGAKRKHNFNENHQHHRNNRANTNQRQHKVNNSNNNSKPPTKKVAKTVPKVPTAIGNNKLKPFAGILCINMHDEDKVEENIFNAEDCSTMLIEDDYYEEPEPVKNNEQKTIQEPALCGALTSLVCDYGSSDEEPNVREPVLNNAKKVKPIKTVDNVIIKEVDSSSNVNKNSKSNNKDSLNSVTPITYAKPNDADSDDDGPDEVKTEKSNSEESNLITQESAGKSKRTISATKTIQCRNNNQRQTTRYKHKVPSTLLYKLLHKEIIKERNIVLQCIRYIKKMNYFEKTH